MDQVMFQHVKVHGFERGPARFVIRWKVCAAELYIKAIALIMVSFAQPERSRNFFKSDI